MAFVKNSTRQESSVGSNNCENLNALSADGFHCSGLTRVYYTLLS